MIDWSQRNEGNIWGKRVAGEGRGMQRVGILFCVVSVTTVAKLNGHTNAYPVIWKYILEKEKKNSF